MESREVLTNTLVHKQQFVSMCRNFVSYEKIVSDILLITESFSQSSDST